MENVLGISLFVVILCAVALVLVGAFAIWFTVAMIVLKVILTIMVLAAVVFVFGLFYCMID